MNLQEKLKSPAQAYNSPSDVLVDEELSHEEKEQVLDAWRQDAERLADSSNEGMAGGEPARLREVALAKQKLGDIPN
jgi:hypothetical protein